MAFNAEIAKTLLADGWRFRGKKRKDRLYLSARKGDREKGFGPFTEEKWSIVESARLSLSSGVGSHESAVGESAQFREAVSQLVSILGSAFRDCVHQRSDGFCGYWLLGSLPSKTADLNEEEFNRLYEVHDNGMRFWRFRVSSTTCKSCPAFVQRVKKVKNTLTRYSERDAYYMHE